MQWFEEQCSWNEQEIINYACYYSEEDDETVLNALASMKWRIISESLILEYPEKPCGTMLEFIRLSRKKGFEAEIDYSTRLKLRKGNTTILVQLWGGTPHIMLCLPRPLVWNEFKRNNPDYLLDVLDILCTRLDELPDLYGRYAAEGKRQAIVAKIQSTLLKEKVEGTGLLDSYEHMIDCPHGETILKIADIAHPATTGSNWIELYLDEDNIDSIIERLPKALADFEKFEDIFPEMCSSWYY